MPKTTRKTADKPADETAEPRVRRTRRAVKPSPRRRTAAAAPAPEPVTHDQIALRAYELHLRGVGADPMENWLRAERELVGAA